MVAKLTRLTHKIAIQLYLVPESCTTSSSCSRQPAQKLLDTPLYSFTFSVLKSQNNGIYNNFFTEWPLKQPLQTLVKHLPATALRTGVLRISLPHLGIDVSPVLRLPYPFLLVVIKRWVQVYLASFVVLKWKPYQIECFNMYPKFVFYHLVSGALLDTGEEVFLKVDAE